MDGVVTALAAGARTMTPGAMIVPTAKVASVYVWRLPALAAFLGRTVKVHLLIDG